MRNGRNSGRSRTRVAWKISAYPLITENAALTTNKMVNFSQIDNAEKAMRRRLAPHETSSCLSFAKLATGRVRPKADFGERYVSKRTPKRLDGNSPALQRWVNGLCVWGRVPSGTTEPFLSSCRTRSFLYLAPQR